MYTVTIDKKDFHLEKEGNSYRVNDSLISWDHTEIKNNIFHLIQNHKSYVIEFLGLDPKTKTITLKINQKTCELQIKDQQDLLLEKLGMTMDRKDEVQEIRAPMPGLILEVRASAGDFIHKGDVLLVLEAMKMENAIRSPQEGRIKEIKIRKGDGVEKNQLLIQF